MGEEFTAAGQSMPRITIGLGTFLLAWGVIISVISKSDSVTSYFPSFLGVPLLVSGVMAHKLPEKRKLWMHIAVSFGLLCAIGGTRFFMVMSDGITYASGSMLMLLMTGSVYTFICVKSFIYARKNPVPVMTKGEQVSDKSQNVVQNITYNITDSAVSGGIDNKIEVN